MIGLNGAPADANVIARMAAAIRHRGPDGAGEYVDGHIGFGFRRLAILDLQPTGHQPMTSDDGSIILIFNGEIYNYIELRRDLQALGHTFRSTGDTEVLLHAYMEWGRDLLPRLNGMWAFLFYDKRRQIVFGSRDRFGKKPLYYYCSPPYFLFASEIKAIVASGHYQGGVHWRKAAAFLLSNNFAEVPEDNETFYDGIKQLPSSTAFELDSHGRVEQWRYWSIAEASRAQHDTQDPPRTWGELFDDTVRLRLRSDVPVGIFLSGGLDSTSILCALSRLREKDRAENSDKLLAFSFQSTEHDESRYIRDTVTQTGVELISFKPEPDELLKELDAFLRCQDEPVHSIVALITFVLSRMAAEHGVKVILNGGGPDEYLAGYPYLFPNYWLTLLKLHGARYARNQIKYYCDHLGGDPRILFRRVQITRFRLMARRLSWYRKLASWKRYMKTRSHPWFTRDLSSLVTMNDSGFIDYNLDSVLKRHVELTPLPHYLKIEDRNSMAHSVEARMPFLDYRLVSFAFRLPVDWKMNGPWNKFVLREAMRGRIPESIRTRPDKMGFPAPTRTWFASTLFGPMTDMIESQGFRERGIYNVVRIKTDMKAHQQGKIDISGPLFNLMQFENWLQHIKSSAVQGLEHGAANPIHL